MKGLYLVLAVMVLAVAACGLTYGKDEYLPGVDKFKACENKGGAGIYWVDTTSGKTWWADPGKMEWVSCGLPKGAKQGPVGTYIPFENKSGTGVFVLNTATGEGWWTDGESWKELGKPGK